ncbi:hypothetical protein G3I71_48205, partial [Streptomyces sp. SID12501]|nr:hypothetical protein [Streptomyces sp. SID12501]
VLGDAPGAGDVPDEHAARAATAATASRAGRADGRFRRTVANVPSREPAGQPPQA